MEPEIKDWARLAAFLDGEGCISIKKRIRGKYIQHSLDVFVCNNDLRLMSWLKDTFGGFITTELRPDEENRKDSYKWYTGQARTEFILRECLPYFILKRQQAEIALVFRKTYLKKQQDEVTPKVFGIRDECKGKLHVLNFRGRHQNSSSDVAV